MHSRVVRAAAWPAGIVLFVLLAAAPPARAAIITVHVFDMDFSTNPAGQPIVDPTIKQGDTIRWQFDSDFHTTTSARGLVEQWDSGLLGPGSVFNHTFTHTGTFEYYCSIHGFDLGNGHTGGMAGKITVQAVPEPAGLSALAVGAAALLVRRRRRR